MSYSVNITKGDNIKINEVSKVDTINKLKVIEKIENVEPIRFCHANMSEAGAEGSLAESGIFEVALIAVAILNTLAQMEIARLRYNIAKDYARIAQDRWERFRTGYMPLEMSMLNEILNTPIPEADCPGSRTRFTRWFRGAFDEAQTRLGEVARKYRLRIDPTLALDLQNYGAMALSDGLNFGYRYEEHRAIMKDDERWNRRSALLNLGRDLQAQSARYSSMANQTLAGLSDLAGQGTAGAMSLLGYLQERQATRYPPTFTGVSGYIGDSGYSLTGNLFSGAQWGVASP